MPESIFILGAGVTGLSAAYASGLKVFEASAYPGGICSSYSIRVGEKERLMTPPEDEDAYRFEIGGGHWIFGGDPAVHRFLRRFSELKTYHRRSAVFFPQSNQYVPYPIQDNLRFLDGNMVSKALQEITNPQGKTNTMKEWLSYHFGPSLCRFFFYPFHELYTAGLYDVIAPQDSYKSPVNVGKVVEGAFNEVSPAGYNVSFAYPSEGLNTLTRLIAKKCLIDYECPVNRIDVKSQEISFADGRCIPYDALISTLPLNKTLAMADLSTADESAPFSSVLVVNIGAERGGLCPNEHWLYIPESRSGFHRVGFYSNVDDSFLPASRRKGKTGVAIYVEKAFEGGVKPSEDETAKQVAGIVAELQDWGFIKEVDIADPTWIEVAYTWNRPCSAWKDAAVKKLRKFDIYQAGRYGRWNFQGIAESIQEGLFMGAAFRSFP